jgi:hypothetical protein
MSVGHGRLQLQRPPALFQWRATAVEFFSRSANIKSLDGHIQTAEGTATVPRFEPAAEEIYYLCAPHGLTATHHDQVNADLLAFIKA